MMKWEEALCPGRNKTGWCIRRNFNSSIPLNVTDGMFTMKFPLDDNLCGRSLSSSEEYLIAGDVQQGGGFYSNMCQLAFPTDHLDEKAKSVLNGTVPLNCENIPHRVYKEDQLQQT
ncbi:hypothetical protein ACJMK2_032694 [Sinanodonta woodiana]|uniref:Uncharacterized protein n=1 Tax=Sinanodonta woodiana TaxID=1069815 RepID=A0ABD3X2I4_SINWO